MSQAIHFYITFNPNKNDYSEPEYTQAHEFYEYLRGLKKKDNDAYAYWGKIISENRDANSSLSIFNEIIEKNSELNTSTHLYITDFKNFWVAKVDEVKKSIGKDRKTLDFYKDKKVEMWFKISDFTLLESGHENTTKRLTHLYIQNEYEEKELYELSPFTSGIKFPAFIQDLDEEYFFDKSDESLVLSEDSLVFNIESLSVRKNLSQFVFGDELYSKLPHGVKVELESAELEFKNKKKNSYNKMAFSYIKALEISVNYLVIHQMKTNGLGKEFYVRPDVMPPKLYLNEFDSENLIPIQKFHRSYSVNQLVYFVQRILKSNRMSFKKAFTGRKKFLKILIDELAPYLETQQINNIRGVLAHADSESVTKEDAMCIRNIILGVGCTGLISKLFLAFYHKELGYLHEVQGDYNNKFVFEKSTIRKINSKKAA